MSERDGLVRQSSSSSSQGYNTESQSGIQNIIHQGLLAVVGGMAVITFIMATYRSAVVEQYGATYFFLGFVNLAIVLMETLLIFFVQNGQLQGEKQTFFYIMGATTFVQSLFTDIALFS